MGNECRESVAGVVVKAAIIRPIFDAAIRNINALERKIASAENDADTMFWTQAEEVVAQLDEGVSQRELAALWINARTGEPYSVMHVNYVRQAVVKFTLQSSRPRFRDAYNAVANKHAVHHSSKSA